jgi:hypothetical protein
MARTYQPATATQRKTATTPLDTNDPGSFDTQDQRDDNRDDSSENRDDSREYRRGSREFGDSRDEHKPRDGDAEQGSRRDQPPVSAGVDAFAPVLEAWKQVFKSWSELAETMVKAQQDAFANMISAANATATNINVGDRQDRELAFSGSRTTASTPDRIERDRR